jgi:hypothetical protein
MHILLTKVQQKILDDKIDHLIAHLSNGLASMHIHLSANQSSKQIAEKLADGYDLLLEIVAIQKDFPAYFHSFPPEAEQLTQGAELATSEQHQIYELLKTHLLETENQHTDYPHSLIMFRQHYPGRRPLMEPYLNLKQQIQLGEAKPTPLQLERLGYGLLTLLQLMVEDGLLHEAVYRPMPQDQEMLLRYNQNRVMSIDEALMTNPKTESIETSSGTERIPCIRCGSYNHLLGYKSEQDGETYFIAYGYKCSHCGFELFDQKDLLLAGIKPAHNYL